MTRPTYPVAQGAARPQERCPRCQRVGRPVERITLKALLRPSGLMRLSADHHSFCPTPDCPVVYFGCHETFDRQDLTVPVFRKKHPGARLVCYCLSITEADIRREILETGRSTASLRGSARIVAGDREEVVLAGGLVTLAPQERHAVGTLRDCAILVTVAMP